MLAEAQIIIFYMGIKKHSTRHILFFSKINIQKIYTDSEKKVINTFKSELIRSYSRKWVAFCSVHTVMTSECQFHKMAQQNPELFWCGDDQKSKRLFNCNVWKLANFVSEAWNKIVHHAFSRWTI